MAKSRQVKAGCLRITPASLLSQVSLEYILIVALTFAIIIPTTYLFYSYSKESSQEITDAQITKLGRGIVDSSETIFYSGVGSKTTLDINLPDNIENVLIIDGRELVFNVTTTFGISEIVFFSSVNLTTDGSNCVANVCSIADLQGPGLNKVKIESVSKDSVSITTI